MYRELSEELINKVHEYTNTEYGSLQLNDNAYSLIEDLLDIIKNLKEENKKETNDYDPEIEIPEIHGKGISW